jgi:hypothetical protein
MRRVPQNRKLARIKGVRVRPDAPVRLIELTDGWAVFPDLGATNRRWQRLGVVSLVALFVAEYLLQRGYGPYQAQGVVAIAIFALILLLAMTDDISRDMASFRRWRTRQQSTLRAGGRGAVRAAMRHVGPTRTVGEMNVLLSSIGRNDPVYSFRRAKQVRVDRRWWRTVVVIDFVSGRTVTYQVSGPRAAVKLANVFSRASSG